MGTHKMSLFITFEGGEGCGKTTQSRALRGELLRMSRQAMLIHEPGGTKLGMRISYLLKWAKSVSISPTAELLMFNASRANLVDETIRPALSQGTIVICDRFTDSTIAYQGFGRGLDIQAVKQVCDIATGALKPDLTVLMDIPAEEGLRRKADSAVGPSGVDRFEEADLDFHKRVRRGYLSMAAEEPSRWFVLDATRPKNEIKRVIWERVEGLLAEKD